MSRGATGPGGARSAGSPTVPRFPRPPGSEQPGGRLPQGHVRLAHRRDDRRHPDHGHGAQRAPGGREGWRHRIREHVPGVRGSLRRRAGAGARHARRALVPRPRSCRTRTRRTPTSSSGASAPRSAPAGVEDANGRKSLVLGATDHVEDGARGRAPYLADLLDRSTLPSGCTGTSGPRRPRHLGQPGCARPAPNRPMSARDMHRTSIAGDEAVQ